MKTTKLVSWLALFTAVAGLSGCTIQVGPPVVAPYPPPGEVMVTPSGQIIADGPYFYYWDGGVRVYIHQGYGGHWYRNGRR